MKALRVHLPNQQLCQMYRKSSVQSDASQLLRYFCRPSEQLFDSLLYSDYFSQYILSPYTLSIPTVTGSRWRENYTGEDLNNKVITPMVVQARKTEKIICRLHTVPPKVGELFYLRVLLLHKPARSFRNLRTILGVEYNTFQEAAVAYGLFDNINEAVYAMEEGVNLFYRPAQLRFLFANLLFDIAFPAIDLWKGFCDALCGDCYVVGTLQVDYSKGLYYIDQLLSGRGATLNSFGLPLPSKESPNILQTEYTLLKAEQGDNINEATTFIATLTDGQRKIFDMILLAIKSQSKNEHRVFFIDGPAGRGKTFLVQTIIKYLKGQ